MREWLIGTYNGLYKIVLEPSMPSRQTILIVVLAFLIGLGWAYVISPKTYYDGDPSQLEQGWQNEWVRLLSERYDSVASTSIQGDEFQQSIISLLAAVDNPVNIIDTEGINVAGFRELALQAQPISKAAPERPTLMGNLMPFIVGPIVMTIASILIALIGRLLVYPNLIEPFIKRLRGEVAVSDESTQRTIDAMRRARAAEDKAKEAATPADSPYGEPVTRKMSVYLMGRGQYDDSFEIEDSNEMFLGECGAAIAETIGDGSPSKVTAIEVWLFDKEDFVRTMTGVFATEYAYNDPALRSKLETKGDIVLLQPGAELILETNTLRLRAKIVEMGYGQGELPPQSFLENSTIEVAVWKKTDSPAPATTPAGPAMASMPAMPSQQVSPAPSFPATPATQATPAMPVMPATPPMMPPSNPATPAYQPVRQEPDDDPFGGTGDFTPVG